MSSLLLSKTDIGFKLFFAHNVRYGNSMTLRIGVALEYLQYLFNHESQRFDFCIECKPIERTCQLYYHQIQIMIIYEGTRFSKWCVSKVFQYSIEIIYDIILR